MTYPNNSATKTWPRTGHWLRADPVNIVTSHDAAYMQGNAELHITPAEQQQILHSINQHLKDDGLQLYALNNVVWYLHSIKPVDCVSPPPLQLLNKAIDVQVFRNQSGIDWLALFTELQMLLYQHPVNELRRSQGIAEISAVWFWQPSLLKSFMAKLCHFFRKK